MRIQELWKLRMFLNINLLILMTISYTQRKNVQLVKLQSEFLSFLINTLFKTSCFICNEKIFLWIFVSDLLGRSTAAYVIAVLLGLTIIVDGWYSFILNYIPCCICWMMKIINSFDLHWIFFNYCRTIV